MLFGSPNKEEETQKVNRMNRGTARRGGLPRRQNSLTLLAEYFPVNHTFPVADANNNFYNALPRTRGNRLLLELMDGESRI